MAGLVSRQTWYPDKQALNEDLRISFVKLEPIVDTEQNRGPTVLGIRDDGKSLID